MKKTLFAALALVSMASCSNEEVLEVAQKEAIGFENAFVNNPTRSFVDPTITIDGTNKLTDFAVNAFVQGGTQTNTASLFDNEKVANTGITNSDLNSSWKYEGTQYWIADAKYNFCAVAPFSGNWTKTSCAVETDATIKTVLDFTNNGTTDLLYAVAKQYTGKTSGNDDVAFDFKHILSKVKFSFQNDYNADKATVKVHNVVITNPHKTGTVTLTHDVNGVITTAWTNQANTTDDSKLTLDFGPATSSGSSTEADAFGVTTLESHKELLLIPGAATETTGYNITFTVELLINGTTITSYNHNVNIALTLEPGKCYDILAKINAKNINPTQAQEPIEFTATVSGWDNTNESQEVKLPVIETPAAGA